MGNCFLMQPRASTDAVCARVTSAALLSSRAQRLAGLDRELDRLRRASAPPGPALTRAGFRYDIPAGAGWPVVTWVDLEGPAGTAGLREGDVIVGVDGVPTREGGALGAGTTDEEGGGDVLGLLRKGPGDTLRLAVRPVAPPAPSAAAGALRMLLVALDCPAQPVTPQHLSPPVAEGWCGPPGWTEGGVGSTGGADAVVAFSGGDVGPVRLGPSLPGEAKGQ